jgi:hypothetical protein
MVLRGNPLVENVEKCDDKWQNPFKEIDSCQAVAADLYNL